MLNIAFGHVGKLYPNGGVLPAVTRSLTREKESAKEARLVPAARAHRLCTVTTGVQKPPLTGQNATICHLLEGPGI